jgi:hypothetical protein
MADVKIKKVDFIEGYARKFGDFGHAMQENVRKCGQMTDRYEDRLRELQKRIEESCIRIEQNLKKAQIDLERLYESDDIHPAGIESASFRVEAMHTQHNTAQQIKGESSKMVKEAHDICTELKESSNRTEQELQQIVEKGVLFLKESVSNIRSYIQYIHIKQ